MNKFLLLKWFIVLIIAFGWNGLAYAQPANDNCATAQSLGTLPAPSGACSGGLIKGNAVTVSTTNVGATPANPYTYLTGCTGGSAPTPANDVWYSFVASGYTAVITISGGTLASAYIAMYEGSCGNLQGRNCVIGTTLTVGQMTVGQTYYIQISGTTSNATGTFDLSVKNNNDCNPCLTTSHITASPMPTNGAYTPGQTVDFCFTVDLWKIQSTNWFHGVQVDFGSGWSGISNMVPAASCDAGGKWLWTNGTVTGNSGNSFGKGFYYDRNNNNIFSDNYGDNCQGAGKTWTFCFRLTVAAACSPGSDLSVTVNTSGDGESGNWTSVACQNDLATKFFAVGACCPPTMTSTPTCAAPAAPIGTAVATPIGTQGPYTYSWTSGGSTIATHTGVAGNDTIKTLSPGSYTVYVTDKNNCQISNNITVASNPSPTVNASNNGPICNGASVNLNSSGASTYSWSTGALVNNTSASPTSTTTYTVWGTNASNCTATATTTVTVNNVPSANLIGGGSICNGSSIPLTVNLGGTGPWTLVYNDGSSNQTVNNIASSPYTINAATSGNYTLVSVSNAQCSGAVSGSASVTINTSPSATISGGGSICPGDNATISVALTGTAPWVIKYNDGNGNVTTVPNINSSPYTFTTGTAGTYTLTDVSDINCSGPVNGSATVTLKPVPTVDAVNNTTYCNGVQTTAITFSGSVGGTTYSWANNNTNIGASASGTNSVGSFTATNTGTTAIVGNFTVTPVAASCVGTPTTFSITVNPTPNVNTVNGETVCNGNNFTAINFSGSVTGTNYSWTNTISNIGLAANGTGNITSFTGTNLTSMTTIGTITVTPEANTCTGTPINFTLTVNPTPNVTPPSDHTYCSGVIATQVALTGGVAGTTFSWNNNNTSIGLVASGSSNIPSFTTSNTTNFPIFGVVSITPTANTCVGAAVTYTYTINPIPMMNALNDVYYCNGDITQQISLYTTPGGGQVNWTNNNTATGLAASGSAFIPSFTAANTGSSIITSLVTITPTLNNCVGPDSTVLITISPSPVLNAIANPTYCTGATSTPVTFTTTPTGSTYSWTNSNNAITGGLSTIGTGDLPSYLAVNQGNSSQTTTITVTPNLNGCVGQNKTFTITVNPQPIANAGSTQNICSGGTANLTGSGGISCIWQPAPTGGNNCTTTTSPITTTTYSLIVTDANTCSDTATMDVIVHGNPTADFSSTSVCLGGTTQFTNASIPPTGENIATYTWTLEAGNFSALQNPTYHYQACGTIQASLTIATNFGCSSSITKPVQVYCLPVAAFSVLDDSLCLGETATFNNQTYSAIGYSNSWSFGSGQGTSSSTNPTYNYTTPGNYNVSLIITTSEGCKDTADIIPVHVFNLPTPDFIATNVCLHDSTTFTNQTQTNGLNGVTYSWNFADASGSALESPKHIYITDGTYNVQLTAQSTEGCHASITKAVQVYPIPFADFTASTVCLGGATAYSVISPVTTDTYSWDYTNDGAYDASGINSSHVFLASGKDTTLLLATSQYGCKNTIKKEITVNALPKAAFTASILNGCEPLSVTFTDTTGNSGSTITAWSWALGNGVSGNNNTTSTTYNAGVYDVKLIVTSNFGCRDTIKKIGYIESYPKPTAKFNYAPTLIQETNGVVLFTDQSIGTIANWLWNFGDTLETSSKTIQNPMHTYPDTGKYCVKLKISTNKGCVDSTTKCLRVEPEFVIYIPNSFTPNEDGVNEKFFPKGRGFKIDDGYELLIFDRWGNLTYRASKYFDFWDGNHQQNGSPCQMDTYVYKLSVKDVFDKKHTFTGQVNLIR